MTYLGDFATSSIVRGFFNTRTAAGTPITLAGTPALSVYKDASVTESTSGVTLTVDYDSRTGMHYFAIDTSADGTFYSSGSEFSIAITTGTVDSVSVVGVVVGRFSLNARSALRPTTSGRTLDVSSGGEAGIDFANIGSPTTTVNLSGTTISTSQAVASVTGAVGSVTGNVGGSVGSVVGAVGSVTGAVGSVTGAVTVGTINANVITTTSINNGAFTAAKFASDFFAGIWGTLTSGLTTVGSIGKLLVDNVNATISSRSTYAGGDTSGTTTLLTRIVGTLASGTHNAQSGDAFARLGAPVGASISADIAAVQSDTDNLQTRIPAALVSGRMDASVGAMAANVLTASALATDAVTEIQTGLATSSQIPAEFTSATFASTGVFATAALANAPSGGGGGPTAAAIADAVWDEAISGHLTSGSTGAALNAAGGAGDPWITTLPGIYIAGQAGKMLADVNAKAALITASNVQFNSMVNTEGYIDGEIIIGDDYLAANGRAFQWTFTPNSGFVAATSSCKFGGSNASGTSTWLVTGSVTDNGNGTWTISFDLPLATTSTLLEGMYEWSAECISATNVEITKKRSGKKVKVVRKWTN